MNRDKLRKILRGKCISDESCEAAIDELLNLYNVRLSSLIDEWFNRQLEFDKIASESVEHHAQVRFNAKAQATRDCWKELKRLIDEA